MYKIYPIGYDPVVASGEPQKDHIDMGLIWTSDETEKMKIMEKNFILSNYCPVGQWCEEIFEN